MGNKTFLLSTIFLCIIYKKIKIKLGKKLYNSDFKHCGLFKGLKVFLWYRSHIAVD